MYGRELEKDMKSGNAKTPTFDHHVWCKMWYEAAVQVGMIKRR